MKEGFEARKWWVPGEGDIVRLRHGFDHSREGSGMRRAGYSLSEDKLYEVMRYEQDPEHKVLHLREVHVIHVAGKRIVSPVERGDELTYSPDAFELAPEHRE